PDLRSRLFGSQTNDILRTNHLPERAPTGHEPVYAHGDFPRSLFDGAYDAVGAVTSVNAQSAVVAHHLLVAPEIARVFAMIGSPSVRTVVIISPNHFHRGKSAAAVSEGSWTTPYGRVDSDLGAVDALLASAPALRKDETCFGKEHGIGLITPFVKRSFPNARIVAIALDDSLSASDAESIGRAIGTWVPSVVIASTDLSHYLPEYIADAHDEVTMSVLRSGRTDFPDIETDSVPTMRTLLAVNAVRELQGWYQTYHGSSLHMGAANAPQDDTSHIMGYFGGPPSNDGVHVMAADKYEAQIARDLLTASYLPLGPVPTWRTRYADTDRVNGYPAEGAARVFRGTSVISAARALELGVRVDTGVTVARRADGILILPERATIGAKGERIRVDYLLLTGKDGTEVRAIPLRETIQGVSPLTDDEAQKVFTQIGLQDGKALLTHVRP
ncbi:MAG: AmmeMemoRadiSam system protein, partial [Candidatus Parcubacteria bacterium]